MADVVCLCETKLWSEDEKDKTTSNYAAMYDLITHRRKAPCGELYYTI